jgi:hypothetical protein
MERDASPTPSSLLPIVLAALLLPGLACGESAGIGADPAAAEAEAASSAAKAGPARPLVRAAQIEGPTLTAVAGSCILDLEEHIVGLLFAGGATHTIANFIEDVWQSLAPIDVSDGLA